MTRNRQQSTEASNSLCLSLDDEQESGGEKEEKKKSTPQSMRRMTSLASPIEKGRFPGAKKVRPRFGSVLSTSSISRGAREEQEKSEEKDKDLVAGVRPRRLTENFIRNYSTNSTPESSSSSIPNSSSYPSVSSKSPATPSPSSLSTPSPSPSPSPSPLSPSPPDTLHPPTPPLSSPSLPPGENTKPFIPTTLPPSVLTENVDQPPVPLRDTQRLREEEKEREREREKEKEKEKEREKEKEKEEGRVRHNLDLNSFGEVGVCNFLYFFIFEL